MKLDMKYLRVPSLVSSVSSYVFEVRAKETKGLRFPKNCSVRINHSIAKK